MASSNHLSLTRYRQGEWFGIVRNGTVVLLGPDTPYALIHTVWELLASAPEAHEVLHEVTDAFGVSLSRIPPFGIIDSKDALRVFLRGDLELHVRLGGAEERITGRDVTTWTERRIADAASFSVRIGEGTAPSAGSPTSGGSLPLNSSPLNSSPLNSSPTNSLPLGEGVVLLASLEATAGAASHADSEPDVRTVAVSDETMIGYTEADIGLTIAPGHMIPTTEASSTEPSESASPSSAAPIAKSPSVDEPLAAVPDFAGVPAPEEAAAPTGETADEEPPSPEHSVVPAEPLAEREPDTATEPEPSGVSVHTSTTDPIVPSLENTTNYDHLWDKTVMRNIEDAAVRTEDESDDHDSPALPSPAAQTPPAPDSPPLTPPHVPQEKASAAPSSGGLIDSVPWLRSGSSTPAAVSDQQAAPSKPLADPPAQVPAAWSSAPQAADEDSDHDGQTIMKSSLPTEEPAGAKTVDSGADAPAVKGPSVLARMCSQGHANPPTYPQCSVCGVAVTGDAAHVPRPRLGRMRLSTGELIDLDQSLIIGRQPSVSRVQGGTMPRLVQVDSPGGDISRSHVEVRLEGWHVMLCDLKATNGTVLIREGQAPRRLAQNEMAILLDGDIAELGDNISLRFEEIL